MNSQVRSHSTTWASASITIACPLVVMIDFSSTRRDYLNPPQPVNLESATLGFTATIREPIRTTFCHTGERRYPGEAVRRNEMDAGVRRHDDSRKEPVERRPGIFI